MHSRDVSRFATVGVATGTVGGLTQGRYTGKTGNYTGLWLTDFGLMELTQNEHKVDGTLCLAGNIKH